MECVVSRDELHMQQDSILVNIEDLQRLDDDSLQKYQIIDMALFIMSVLHSSRPPPLLKVLFCEGKYYKHTPQRPQTKKGPLR